MRPFRAGFICAAIALVDAAAVTWTAITREKPPSTETPTTTITRRVDRSFQAIGTAEGGAATTYKEIRLEEVTNTFLVTRPTTISREATYVLSASGYRYSIDPFSTVQGTNLPIRRFGTGLSCTYGPGETRVECVYIDPDEHFGTTDTITGSAALETWENVGSLKGNGAAKVTGTSLHLISLVLGGVAVGMALVL